MGLCIAVNTRVSIELRRESCRLSVDDAVAQMEQGYASLELLHKDLRAARTALTRVIRLIEKG